MDRIFKLANLIAVSLFAHVALAGNLGESVKQVGIAVFSDVERAVIRDYYERKYSSMDDQYDRYRRHQWSDDYDGKRKKRHKHAKGNGSSRGNPKGLPPGIAKKLERGGELPPGIAMKDLPDDLESQLPPVRTGYKRIEADGEIVLLEETTDTIVDIIGRVEALKAAD